jgi:uncharacterized protein (UPF0335 family)
MLGFFQRDFPRELAYVTGSYLAQSVPEPIESFGYDVNIIRLVEEHGPVRITQITDELQELTNKISRLEAERNTLERLVAATK